MFKAVCTCCGAAQWVKITEDDPDTGSIECEVPDPDDWEGGCIVIDGLFYFDVLCDHDEFEYTDHEFSYE